jgi:hypothetical protein
MIRTLLLTLLLVGVAQATTTNIYWRVDLNQGSSIIAYGQGATEADAWADCFRLQAITRAMTAAETRKIAVAAVTTSVVRWCKNPIRYATVTADLAGQAALSWSPPVVNTDGSTLTDLAGYRVSYGTSASALTSTIQIANPGLRSYTISNLAPGTYYFAVRAYSTTGNESANSNVVSKNVS